MLEENLGNPAGGEYGIGLFTYGPSQITPTKQTMKKNLNNKKQEWVTPLIKEMTINDNEGKITSGAEGITFSGSAYGSS